jgi:hypothetical protein
VLAGRVCVGGSCGCHVVNDREHVEPANEFGPLKDPLDLCASSLYLTFALLGVFAWWVRGCALIVRVWAQRGLIAVFDG